MHDILASPRFRARRWLAASFLLSLTLSACDARGFYNDDNDRDARGDYTLRTANAQPLPATLQVNDAGRLEVLAASLILERNGSCRGWFRLRATTGGVSTTFERTERCFWSQFRTTLRLHWGDATSSTATYANDGRVTLRDEGNDFYFTR